MYVNLVNCLFTRHLIIPSHLLQDVREFGHYYCLKTPYLILHRSLERTWTGQLFEYLSSDHPISSPVSRKYVNLINHFITSQLIIPSYPSPGCSWIWSIVLIPLIWSSYPFPFLSSYPERTWTWPIIIIWILLIWSCYPLFRKCVNFSCF